jgi:hypothetical protein
VNPLELATAYQQSAVAAAACATGVADATAAGPRSPEDLAAALARAVPGLEATVLDLPAVEAVTAGG